MKNQGFTSRVVVVSSTAHIMSTVNLNDLHF